MTALSMTSCGGNNENEISISGAFALNPFVIKCADGYMKLHPEVKIDVSQGGAGKGVTDVLANQVDLGMVSREIRPEETKGGAFAIAVVKDAVVPTVNADNPALAALLEKGLTREAAYRLWVKQDLKTWGELLGTANDAPINVYTRSDACGAAETWALWFDSRQEDLGGTAVNGDPGLAKAVQDDVNGIGFNNIGYAYDENTRKPHAKLAILPIDVNGNGRIDAEERIYDTKDQLVEAIAQGLYPAPPARDLYLVSNGKPKKEVVIDFLRYVLTEGQQFSKEAGFVTLEEDKIHRGLQSIAVAEQDEVKAEN